MASSMPSIPRCPNPPGTRMPLSGGSGESRGRRLYEVNTHPAPTTVFHASWYLAGLISCISCSRFEASTHCCMCQRCVTLCPEDTLTWRMSFLLQRNAECSRDFTTDMYESVISVYLPTSTIETSSSTRSCLRVLCEGYGQDRLGTQTFS